MNLKGHQPALVVLLVGVVVALLPFLLGSVGDFEEFYGTAIPMTLAFRALGEGASPFWTPLLGLGMPQPFRISYLLHPLGPAFALGPEAGVNVLTSVHLGVGAIATYYLAIDLGVTRLVAVVCAISAVFSTTITQVLYYDDWFPHVVTWSLLPLSALTLLRLLDAEDRAAAAFYSLALGLVVGFQIATGLIGRPFAHVLLIAPLALARPAATLRKSGWLAAAAIVALVSGASNVLPLLDELSRAYGALRSQHRNPPIGAHLWGAFVRPFEVLTGAASPDSADTLRVVGFGPVFAVLALAQLVRRAHPNVRAVGVALLASIAYLLLPPAAYLDIVTSTWLFRDGVNLYGILLAGVLLASVKPPIVQIAIGMLQCVLVWVAAWPLWSHNLLRPSAPEARTEVVARDLACSSDIVRALQASTAGRASRVLFAPHFRDRMGAFAPDGIAHDTLAYHGVPVVDVVARGIATSALHPDASLLQGHIRAGPATLFDSNLLNVLGITHVLALPEDRYGAGLTLERTVRSRRGQEVHILRNHAAWPRGVFLDEAAAGVSLGRLAGCGHDRLFCADFAPVVAHRRAGPEIEVVERHGTMRIRMPPADTARIVMLSTWFRPGWRIAPASASMFPVFEQLTAIRIPPGIAEVRLSYVPAVRLWSHVASGLMLLAGTLGLLGLRRRRARVRGASRGET